MKKFSIPPPLLERIPLFNYPNQISGYLTPFPTRYPIMKPTAKFRSFLLASSVFAAPAAPAAILYWDGNATQTANADGGAGNWDDNNLTNWDTLATAGADSVWLSSNPDSAVFGATAGAVTLTAPITVGGLTFNTTAYQLISNAPNTLSFGAANNTVTLNNIALVNLTGSFGGSGNVSFVASNPSTAGEARFNGTSTGGWSGSTTIGGGATVSVLSSNQALLNTTGITLNGGGMTIGGVDSTQGALDKVSNSAGITSNGGTITYTNTSGAGVYAETLGSVALTSGALNVILTNNQASTGSQTLTLSGLTRTGAPNTSAVSFSATGGLTTTKNMVVVNGATATVANEIVGPWATVGTAANAQTDYAVYNSSAQVVAREIAATTEDFWSSGTNVTLGGGTTLTATRSLNSLRYTGAAGALALGSFNLETSGLLNGGSGLLTVSGGGTLTTASGRKALRHPRLQCHHRQLSDQ